MGQVRAPHGLTRRAARGDLGQVHLQAQLAQAVQDAVVAQLALGSEALERVGQRGMARVEGVAEHVHVEVGAADGADLDARGHPDSARAARRHRLGDAVDGVVVGQGE